MASHHLVTSIYYSSPYTCHLRIIKVCNPYYLFLTAIYLRSMLLIAFRFVAELSPLEFALLVLELLALAVDCVAAPESPDLLVRPYLFLNCFLRSFLISSSNLLIVASFFFRTWTLSESYHPVMPWASANTRCFISPNFSEHNRHSDIVSSFHFIPRSLSTLFVLYLLIAFKNVTLLHYSKPTASDGWNRCHISVESVIFFIKLMLVLPTEPYSQQKYCSVAF